MTTKKKKLNNSQKSPTVSIAVTIGVILLVGIFGQDLWADQITHKFKSPSFSGINTSSHYLTIENQEFNRRQTIKDELKAAIEEAERDKENSTVQRFIRNFESRVYAELSRQLIANLFGETPQDSGTITLEGNTIEYSSDGTYLTLKITEADGTITHITIPIGSFTF
jgi:DNA integrity scanning protein DisA with diadenylate cyclase activity|tara:strand:- start:1481 stop:1981 length:501 start_codon:yes stop_codon:yes gene_type:complete